MQRYKCIHCFASVTCTTQVSSGKSGTLRRSLCPKCKRIADIYALNSLALPLDILLFRSEAFTHLLFNREPLSFLFLLTIKALSMFVDVSFSFFFGRPFLFLFGIPTIVFSFFAFVFEAFFLPFAFGYPKNTFRLFCACTLLSSVSLSKVVLFFYPGSFHPHLIDLLVSLLLSRAIATIRSLSFISVLFCISFFRFSGLIYSE